MTAAGLLVAVPRAWAQARLARIGFLASTNPEGGPHLAAFREGLRTHGWVEGKNLDMTIRWAEGNFEQRPELVAELVRLKVDCIMTWGSTATAAARRATTTIPIVFAAVGDPVGAGFASSLARPGGNITGMSNIVRDLSAKEVETLAQTVPGLRRLAILRNPGNPVTSLLLRKAERAARALELEHQVFEVRGPSDFEAAFAAMKKERVGGVVLLGDPMVHGRRNEIAQLAIRHGLPSIFIVADYPDAGGLMSYGTEFRDLFRRAAGYVDKILKGANPADLPIEQPVKFELLINMRTAKVLGVKVPPSVLLRADRVIE
jgi:putative ABC transport system substrate-binding protein